VVLVRRSAGWRFDREFAAPNASTNLECQLIKRARPVC
jgi:hypothetical protein